MSNRNYSSSYVVCPISGLSFTIHSDWNATRLSNFTHPDATNYTVMAKAIRAHLKTIPKTYIAAFCQVWARENNLLVTAKTSYEAGFITESLASLARPKLIDLFWTCYNSKAGILPRPITINLGDTKHPNAIYDLFAIAATQRIDDFIKSQMRSTYRPKIKGTVKSKLNKMDAVTCINRLAKLMPKLANALPEETITVESARKAARLLPDYANIKPATRDRIEEIVYDLFTLAEKHGYYSRDSLEYKSFEIVYRLLTSEHAPIELQEVEF